MGGIKAKLEEIADLAYDKIEKWLSMESQEFFSYDKEEQYDIIEDGLDEFFNLYGGGIADEEGISIDELQEFVSDHFSFIAKLVADKL